MLHRLIEKLSDYPRFFLFCRRLLEDNFKVIRKTIQEHLVSSRDQTVLDIACGPGAFSNLFTPEKYTGGDINPKYIDFAKKNYHGRFSVQDARTLQFPDRSFDHVLVYGLLHHLSDQDAIKVLSGVQRVLKSGGKALIIEDIPTESNLNLLGHLLHSAENGHFIRPANDYHKLLEPFFRFEDEKLFRSGICDYYMARVIVKPTDPEIQNCKNQ